jgi:uncharacterized protein (TIGR02246 family)
VNAVHPAQAELCAVRAHEQIGSVSIRTDNALVNWFAAEVALCGRPIAAGRVVSCGQTAEGKMTRIARFIFVTWMLVSPAVASAGPAEDANAAVDRWSAAYSGNDPETIAGNYWPDAILLGTVSPVISEGTQAIETYFMRTKGTGNKNTIDERRTIVIDDNAVLVTGFYTFIRMPEGKPTPSPSRFTMLITRRGNEWRIAHHHSSPHVQPKK